MRIAISGNFVADVELRQFQQHPQIVFKLHPGEPPHRPAPVLRHLCLRGLQQLRAELHDELLPFLRADLRLLRRRHFALSDEVKHPRPPRAIARVIEPEGERRDVEVALGDAIVMAVDAVFPDESMDRSHAHRLRSRHV